MAVEFELSEVGVHTLRVGVSYLDPLTNEPKSLRKFYRFQVLNPLTITFKHVLIQDISFVEAKIQNITQIPLHADTIVFVPSPPFEAQQLTAPDNDNANNLIFPDDSIQCIFKVTAEHLDLSLGTLNLGRLEVNWKSAMGESGRLQTQPVMRKVGSVKEATVTVLLPTPVVAQVGQPFVASVLIQNNGTRAMNLQLQLRRDLMLGILCSSVSHLNVGIVQGKSSVHVSVELLPLIAGLQQIRGVLAVDMDSQVEFAMEKPVYVLVK
ncbi:hypothetical protein, variant 2 [Aphanomyces astaci]|nr:hypothetical protein, variant 2 [Aphanomyces astaci]ETV64815.1 hypothetical protein, variant 2 [Aphanomyces astaci]|eukprot:XP_009845705.1 hypothetical protein, variant 2 [Aphanomyces astaci]